jgi:hypothetical protein
MTAAYSDDDATLVTRVSVEKKKKNNVARWEATFGGGSGAAGRSNREG